MIRCLAIDDEPLALRQLTSYISKVPYLELVAACHSARQASEILSGESVDVMFVDINMPDLSGMDFVKQLVNAPMIVFTTAYSEYAIEGYKVDAVDYLLKPFGLEDFRRSAEKVKKLYERDHAPVPEQATVATSDGDDALFFKTDYKIVRVATGDIVYVEGMSEYLKIHLESDSIPIVVLLSMKKLEERLPSNRFMRIHKSYIVNLGKIREVSKNRVLVGKDVSLPIGDSYRDAFGAFLGSKFLGK